MSKSDDIAKGIYKGWLAIAGTRLVVTCLVAVLFFIFMICLYVWFLNTLLHSGPISIITPAK
jgi:uncharacterized membrane protein YqhA